MSRAWTNEEVREKFLDQCRALAAFWAGLPDKTNQERCDGVVFSILNILDGTSCGFPAVNCTVAPHPDDKAFLEAEGENWFDPEAGHFNECYMHEMYYPPSSRDGQSRTGKGGVR